MPPTSVNTVPSSSPPVTSSRAAGSVATNFAMRRSFVMMVKGFPRSATATWYVVDPLSRMTASPSETSAAAASAISFFAARLAVCLRA